jgi:hypothetical protein
VPRAANEGPPLFLVNGCISELPFACACTAGPFSQVPLQPPHLQHIPTPIWEAAIM